LLVLSPSFLVPRSSTRVTVWPRDRRVPTGALPARRPAPDGPPVHTAGRSARGARGCEPALGAADEHDRPPPRLPVFSGAKADIVRITAIWRDCLGKSGGRSLRPPPHDGGCDVRADRSRFVTTTSPWTPRVPPTATRCSRHRRRRVGERAALSPRSWSSSAEFDPRPASGDRPLQRYSPPAAPVRRV
jgi:hypothetical protein